MKVFDFQKFSILQGKEVFRVGTDGVLLGTLANCSKAKNILEVGTGTGIISLMLAQRNEIAQILALDISKKAINLAKTNFENSPFKNRLKTNYIDFKIFNSNEKFDLIVSNPPYFEPTKLSQKDLLARQQVELNFTQLIENSVKFLSQNGIFSVIIPKESKKLFVDLCQEKGLFLIRKVEIQGNEDSPIKRCVLEFCFQDKETKMEKLVLEVSPRCYSAQYLELTKDFHIFKS